MTCESHWPALSVMTFLRRLCGLLFHVVKIRESEEFEPLNYGLHVTLFSLFLRAWVLHPICDFTEIFQVRVLLRQEKTFDSQVFNFCQKLQKMIHFSLIGNKYTQVRVKFWLLWQLILGDFKTTLFPFDILASRNSRESFGLLVQCLLQGKTTHWASNQNWIENSIHQNIFQAIHFVMGLKFIDWNRKTAKKFVKTLKSMNKSTRKSTRELDQW